MQIPSFISIFSYDGCSVTRAIIQHLIIWLLFSINFTQNIFVWQKRRLPLLENQECRLSVDRVLPFRSIWFVLTNCGSHKITNKICISVVAEVVSRHVLVNVSSLVPHMDVENYDTFAHVHHHSIVLCNLIYIHEINNTVFHIIYHSVWQSLQNLILKTLWK